MKQRIITGLILFLILVPLLLIEELFPLFQLLLLVLTVIASLEMIKLYEKNKKFPDIVKIFIVLFSALIYMSCLSEWAAFVKSSQSKLDIDESFATHLLDLFNLHIGFLPMFILCVIIFLACMVFCKGFEAGDVGKALTTICYTGLGFGALTILRFLGLRFIVYLFMITTLTDVFAYFGGYKFGRHKMCPTISPKKTWEGAVIGSFVAVLCATFISFFYGKLFSGYFNEQGIDTLFSNTQGICIFWKGDFDSLNKVLQFLAIFFISIFISVAGQVGDLVASKFKRSYDIKDFGSIFPGHGGVLDRCDSVIFAATALLLVFVIL